MSQSKPRTCLTIQDLTVGMNFELPYEVTEEDVQKFGEISGDFNPAHFDDDYAAGTRFGKRIAHGMISVAKFSGIFGMDLPGLGAIWAGQKVKFLAPVYLNEPYTAKAEVIEVGEKSVKLRTTCSDAEGNHVLEGEGVLYPIPKKIKDGMGDQLSQLLQS